MQSCHGIGTILAQGPVALRLDDDDAVRCYSRVSGIQQTSLDIGRQVTAANIKSQVCRAGHLVNVLPARALRTDRTDLDIARPDLPVPATCLGAAVALCGRVNGRIDHCAIIASQSPVNVA